VMSRLAVELLVWASVLSVSGAAQIVHNLS
jgi:hypothetical protein